MIRCARRVFIRKRYTCIYWGYAMHDIHSIPLRLKKHVAEALAQRFRIVPEDVEHYIKTARIVKSIEKDGKIGILQGKIGDCKIQFICTIREKVLYIITVEECE
jgi:hypothetical protein